MNIPSVTGATALGLALLLAGCGDDQSSDNPDTSLKNADEVRSQEQAGQNARAKTVDLGEFVELGSGLRLSASKVVVGGDELGPWLIATVRIENSSDEEAAPPDGGIICSNATEPGGSQAGSTLDVSGGLPAESFAEGTLNLLLPEDGRYGEKIQDCQGPAFLQFTKTGLVDDSDLPVRIRVPEDTLAELLVRTSQFNKSL